MRECKGSSRDDADRRPSNFRKVFINPTEMFLWTIYVLEESAGVPPTRAEIWRQFDLSRTAVDERIVTMRQSGLITMTAQRRIVLTDRGRSRAVVVMRKHRLVERALVDIVGLEWELAHAEATRWQHVLGEAVERKLLRILDDPTHSPFGNPIPGLGELDPSREGASRGIDEVDLVSLAEAAHAGVGRARIRRIAEQAQGDGELLAALRAACVVPGQAIRISVTDRDHPDVRVATAGGYVVLRRAASEAILVSVDDRCG